MTRATVLFITQKRSFFLDLEHILLLEDITVDWVANNQNIEPYFDTDHTSLVVFACQADEGISLGLTIIKKIRSHYSGLLVMVTDQEDSQFHALALGLGVDASLTYCAGPPLVAANILALLRRFTLNISSPHFKCGSLTIDARRRDAFVAGQAAELSTMEFQLLWTLAQKSGCVVTRDEIHRNLYKTAYNGYDRSIDLYVSRIRQKIGDSSESPRYLKTVRGVGYQFIDVEEIKPGRAVL